jgi:hypothetical protein
MNKEIVDRAMDAPAKQFLTDEEITRRTCDRRRDGIPPRRAGRADGPPIVYTHPPVAPPLPPPLTPGAHAPDRSGIASGGIGGAVGGTSRANPNESGVIPHCHICLIHIRRQVTRLAPGIRRTRARPSREPASRSPFQPVHAHTRAHGRAAGRGGADRQGGTAGRAPTGYSTPSLLTRPRGDGGRRTTARAAGSGTRPHGDGGRFKRRTGAHSKKLAANHRTDINRGEPLVKKRAVTAAHHRHA